MKYVHFVSTNDQGTEIEGVCHKSKLEYLAVPTCKIAFEPISDEDYAKLVDSYGGVETAPAVKAKPKKNANTEGESLV